MNFFTLFNNLQVAIPFSEALQQIHVYAEILKELLTKKRQFPTNERVKLWKGCKTNIQQKLPLKHHDP